MNLENFNNIYNAINRSNYIYIHDFDIYNSIIFVWHGGKIINIYDMNFKAIDCFTSMHKINITDVKQLIDDHIKENYNN